MNNINIFKIVCLQELRLRIDLEKYKIIFVFVIANEFQETNAKVSSEKLKVPHYSTISFSKEIATHVSFFVVKNFLSNIKYLSLVMQPNFTGNCIINMGLSCAHKMSEWVQSRMSIGVIL